MDFDALFAQVIALLQHEQRISYRVLKRRFALSDDDLADVKDELIYAKKLAVDEENRVLVWTGGTAPMALPTPAPSHLEPALPHTTDHEREPLSYTPKHLAEKILTSRSALEGERKQVTVLFCDLANSTPIAERIGPEHMHTLLNRFFELALHDVHRYEGTVNQFLGDGFMALFGAPIAHEDHARRGVLSALALQRTLKEADLGRSYGVECAFRMGLNSGLVVVGSIGDNLRMDYSAIGDTTNLAARLQQVTASGTILMSEATSRLVQGYIRVEALPPVEVRGKTEPVTSYKVLGTLPRRSPMVSRGEHTLSQFVGRERDIATLTELFAQVEREHGQVVGIVAEAGGGKSRLLYEFRQRLQDKRVTFLEGQCLSYGSSIPYHPIIDLVRQHCAIAEGDNAETMLEKVRCALQEVGMDAEEFSPYLLQLLGVKKGTESIAILTPEATRTRTFETLKQMSLQGSEQRPLYVEIEDLHWIDHTSQDYLVSLVESLAGASIMLLTTYRPGYRPPWLEKSYATQISLHSLAPQDAFTVVRSTREHTALPVHLEQTIIEKSQGNPFFLEELTRAVVEQRDLHAEVTVPDTIHGVLSARIDRLSEEHKQLLQMAAVLGREFSPRLLAVLWEGTDVLAPLLSELQRMEFLFERTGAKEPIYVFKNALTQEVAYESPLTPRRQAIHAAAGHAMEQLYREGLVERYEALAHHFTRGAVWEKAFDYLTKSGDKARQAYANQEAVALYTQAIEVSGRISPPLEEVRLLPVYEVRGLSWAWLLQYDAAIADFQMMHQMARASGNLYKEGDSLCHLAQVYLSKSPGDHIAFVEQYAQEAMHLFHQTGDQYIRTRSLRSLGLVEQDRGNLLEAERHFEEAVRISRQEGFQDNLAQTLARLMTGAYWQGHFPRVVQMSQEGLMVARAIHDGYSELLDHAILCLACWSAGHYIQALTVLHEGMAKAEERDSKIAIGRLMNTLGWFHREFGDLSRAVEYDQESMELGRTYSVGNVEVSALINLGLDSLALGQHARALSYLEPTLDRVVREAFGAHRWRWQIRLLIGLAELSYTTGAYDQALRYVEEGLQEAQRTSSQKYVALAACRRENAMANSQASRLVYRRRCT